MRLSISILLILSVFISVLFSESNLPSEARKLIKTYNKIEQKEISKVHKKLKPKRQKLIKDLKRIQKKYADKEDYMSAMAIKNKIKLLMLQDKLAGYNVLTDPGNLSSIRASAGDIIYVMVKARKSGGSLWGTDVYTTDSILAMAVVHSGVLKDGEEDVVKIIFDEGRTSYKGSVKNGVTSSSWGKYHASFRIKKVNK